MGLLAGSASLENPAVLLWIGTTALVILSGIAFSIVRERDPFSPLLVLCVVFALLYVLRPLYILSVGLYGPTRTADRQNVTVDLIPTMANTARLAALGVGAFVVGYAAARALAPVRSRITGRADGLRPTRGEPRINREWAVLLTTVCAGLAVATYYMLIRDAGGIDGYIAELSRRSSFFFGRAYLAAVAIPLKVIVLVLAALVLAERRPSYGARVGIAGLIALVVIGDFLTGGRAAMITGTLLPVVVIFHYLKRPLGAQHVVVLALVGLVLFVTARVVTRDAVYAGTQTSTGELVQQAFLNLPETTVGGQDAIPFDSLMRLVDEDARGSQLQWGQTYLPILVFPVPRALWDGKPLGGGNAWFTSTYYPTFYFPDNVETSISFFGESFANFGIVGVLVLPFGVGFAISLLYARLVASRSPIAVVAWAVSLGYLITLIRGDAFHSVTSLALALGLLVPVAYLLTRSRGRTVGAELARSGPPSPTA